MTTNNLGDLPEKNNIKVDLMWAEFNKPRLESISRILWTRQLSFGIQYKANYFLN